MKPHEMVRALTSDETSVEDDTSTTALLPLRFLGMGVFIAWLCCTHVSSIFPNESVGYTYRDLIDTTMRIGDIGTFLILALLATRIGPISKHPLWCTIAVLITALGTALIGLVFVPYSFPAEIVTAASIITAIGGAFLFCLWAELYSQMGATRAMTYGALSCITAFLGYLIISSMVQPNALIATALLPLLSFACVVLSFRIVPHERTRQSGVRYPIPWKLLLLMAIAGLMSGLSSVLIPSLGGVGAIHRVVVTGLAGIVILCMVFFLRERADIRFLARFCLPVAILAFALVPFTSPLQSYVISFLVKLSYVWFTFFVLLMLANIAYRFEVPSLRLFSIARACSEGAILIGILLRNEVRQSNFLSNTPMLYAAAVIGILLVIVCAFIWTREKSVNADWGAAGVNVESGIHVAGPRERLMQRCDTLASAYDLTTREAEILALIAQGKSRAEIGQELFLSQNTIKTHSRNLYAKLDVHSKEEVYKLFEP